MTITREMLAEVMQDAWGEICDDTGAHPSDMQHGSGTVLLYRPSHWTDLIALRLQERLATPPATPAGGGLPRAALPERIGRVSLGERPAPGDRLCSHGHEVPAGHPLYWPPREGEYPDDIDPLCLAHAIEQAESDSGWCDCSIRDALAEDDDDLRAALDLPAQATPSTPKDR